MLRYDTAMASAPVERRQSFDGRDAILYALGLGLGSDPTDPVELAYLNEAGLRVLPTFPAAMAFVSPADFNLPLDLTRGLHGEQRLTIHRPLPTGGTVVGRARVSDLIDLGPATGALVMVERDITDAASGALLATAGISVICRGDGGFGGPPRPRRVAPDPPDRAPDRTVDVPISRRAGLIYRLSGDYHQLHIDPQLARRAGFDRPILHGLATYGIIGWAVLRHLFDGDGGAMRSFDGRFSAPVYPGDTLHIEMWKSASEVHVRAGVAARGQLVFTQGRMGVA